MNKIVLVLLFGMNCGCTHIESEPIYLINVKNQDQPPSGDLYGLAARQFTIETEIEIKDCAVINNMAHLDYSQSVKVQSDIVQDPFIQFNIPYENLNSLTKITSLDIKYWDNGTIKSINSIIDDRTGETLASITAGSIDLIEAAAKRSTPIGGTQLFRASVERAKSQCDDINNIRSELREDEKALKISLSEIDSKKQDYQLLNAGGVAADAMRNRLLIAKQAGNQDDIAVSNNSLSEEITRNKTLRESFEKPSITANVANLQKKIDKQKKRLTFKKNITWIPDYRKIENKEGKIELSTDIVISSDELAQKFDLPREEIEAIYTKVLLFRRVSNFSAIKIEKSVDGIVYRKPATANLLVCRLIKEKQGCGIDDDKGENVLYKENFSVPQFGDFALLSLHNYLFDNNTIEASFSPDGTLLSSKYTSTARAERAAKTFEIIAAKLNAHADRANEIDQANLERRNKLIQTQTSYFNELSKLEGARKGLKDEKDVELQRLEAEVNRANKEAELIKAQTELLKAQQELEKIKADIPLNN